MLENKKQSQPKIDLTPNQLRCRLCGAQADLCRSHVLPEFLYQPLYDEKHRYNVISLRGRDGLAQKGLRERMLCASCEGRLSLYEDYAADLMTGRLGHRFTQKDGRINLSGIDYTRFKLFQLSFLWRASVSSLEFFKLVDLGPHEERIRQMLLAGDAGPPERFGCMVVFATLDEEAVIDTMFNPEQFRRSGHNMTKFFFAGSSWIFHCDSRAAPNYLRQFFLQEDGSLMALYGDMEESRFLAKQVRTSLKHLGF